MVYGWTVKNWMNGMKKYMINLKKKRKTVTVDQYGKRWGGNFCFNSLNSSSNDMLIMRRSWVNKRKENGCEGDENVTST